MASEKILESKKNVVSEIGNKLKNSESVILFKYAQCASEEKSKNRTIDAAIPA